MGYTIFTIELLEKVIKEYNPKNVLDLGSQQLYNQPTLPAPYVDQWYKPQGIDYECIDLNGENNSRKIDLSKKRDYNISDLNWSLKNYHGWKLVVDAGTSEHVGDDGKFSWEAIYHCWKIKHDSLQVGGIMVNENPKTGNWFSHGYNYYTEDFYKELAEVTDYKILELGEHAAMGNFVDGWNIYCVMIKNGEKFPSLEEFKKLSIKTS